MKFLYLDVSILGEYFVSCQFLVQIVVCLCVLYLVLEVVYCDFVVVVFVYLLLQYLVVFNGVEVSYFVLQVDLVLGQVCLDELLQVDLLVIGVLMYNFLLLLLLKVWIDRVVVVGIIFVYGEVGLEGLFKGCCVYIVLVCGGQYEEGMLEVVLDYQECYLQDLLGFFGIVDVIVVCVEGVVMGESEKVQVLVDVVVCIVFLCV